MSLHPGEQVVWVLNPLQKPDWLRDWILLASFYAEWLYFLFWSQCLSLEFLLSSNLQDGNTALHVACDRGHDSLVKLLIHAHADLGIANKVSLRWLGCIAQRIDSAFKYGASSPGYTAYACVACKYDGTRVYEPSTCRKSVIIFKGVQVKSTWSRLSLEEFPLWRLVEGSMDRLHMMCSSMIQGSCAAGIVRERESCSWEGSWPFCENSAVDVSSASCPSLPLDGEEVGEKISNCSETGMGVEDG